MSRHSSFQRCSASSDEEKYLKQLTLELKALKCWKEEEMLVRERGKEKRDRYYAILEKEQRDIYYGEVARKNEE